MAITRVQSEDLQDLSIVNADVSNSAAIVESKLALNFPTHDNANDPTAGEKAALEGTSGTPGAGAEITKIDLAATGWRYHFGDVDYFASSPPFYDPTFDPDSPPSGSAFSTGQALIGFGDLTGPSGNRTINTAISNPSEVRALYLIKTFTVDEADDVNSATIELYADDAAAVWINGTEVATRWDPPNPRAHSSAAGSTIGAPDEGALSSPISVDPAVFVDGTNIIAMAVFNVNAGSSDLGADLILKTVEGSNRYVTEVDPRLSDSRTPTAHASTHAPAGSDPVSGLTNASIDASAAIAESKLALNFATHSNANDPSSGQKAALAGTAGTPADGNRYVTNDDTRNTNARTPTAHASTHIPAGSDPLTGLTNASIDAAAAIVESKLSLNFATHSNANDPSSGQKAALAGTSGTPGDSNRYVTNDDSRNTNARTPTAHASTHGYTSSDPLIAPIVLGAAALDSDVTAFGTFDFVSVRNNNNGPAVGLIANNTTAAAGAIIGSFRTRGTGTDANTIVASGDVIASIRGYAADGASYRLAAQINFEVDGTPGSSDMPGRIVFSVTADGGITLSEAMRIQNDGAVGIGQTPIAGTKLHVAGILYNGTLTALSSDLTSAIGSGPAMVAERALAPVFAGIKTGSLGIGGFTYYGIRTRDSTNSADTIVLDGQEILAIRALAADGLVYRDLGAITMNVDGSPGSGDMPGRISFLVTPDGSSSLIERIRISNAGIFSHYGASNGQELQIRTVSTTVNCSGATTNATNLIPAGSLVFGVTVRVTTAITGATSFGVGDTTSATIYGTSVAIAQNTTTSLTNQSNRVSPLIYNTATTVRLTANGGNFSGGVVRITVHYINIVPATG